MRAVLLAGGLGTRFAEETDVRPKPMIEIGGKPILWHIMKIYSSHGINDFIICLGYKGYVIKEYFSNYFLHQSNVTFDLRENRMEVLQKHAEPWRVTLIDTGEETMIGGRIKRILPYIGDDDAFCLTYGDGVGFGAINHQGSRVTGFQEKPRGDGNWINGGFFVLSPKVGDYIEGDATVWEKEPMTNLAEAGQLSVFLHDGFWHPMDTLRDKRYLEDLWSSNKAPWKKW